MLPEASTSVTVALVTPLVTASVASGATETPPVASLGTAAEELMISVPRVIRVPPPYEFDPSSTKVPMPTVSRPAVPLRGAEIVAVNCGPTSICCVDETSTICPPDVPVMR